MSATRDEPKQPTERGTVVGDEDEPTPQQERTVESDETSQELPVDRVFELLKNQRRREVLQYLKESDEETVSLSDLAEHIAAIENDTTVQAISSSERKRVYVGLYQCHLPKMDDMDVVSFDQNRGTISLGPNASQLETFLDVEEDQGRPWPRYYAAIAVGGASLYTVATFVPMLSVSVVVPLLIGAFFACALANEYVERSVEDDEEDSS